jgi:hypothetical protein
LTLTAKMGGALSAPQDNNSPTPRSPRSGATVNVSEYDAETVNREYLAAIDLLNFATSSADFVKALNEIGVLFDKYPTVVTHRDNGWVRVDGVEERFAAEQHLATIDSKFQKLSLGSLPNIEVPKVSLSVISYW